MELRSVRFFIITWATFLCGTLHAETAPIEAFRQPASINRAVQALAKPSRLFYNGETLISADLIENYRKLKAAEAQEFRTSDYLPTNLHPSSDPFYIASAIADRTLNSVLNSAAIRQSSLGRAAQKVENAMTQQVVINTTEGVDHKFDFQVQVFQSSAQIRYQGYFNASLFYEAKTDVKAIEMNEKIFTSKQIVLSHQLRPEQKISQVSLRWDW